MIIFTCVVLQSILLISRLISKHFQHKTSIHLGLGMMLVAYDSTYVLWNKCILNNKWNINVSRPDNYICLLSFSRCFLSNSQMDVQSSLFTVWTAQCRSVFGFVPIVFPSWQEDWHHQSVSVWVESVEKIKIYWKTKIYLYNSYADLYEFTAVGGLRRNHFKNTPKGYRNSLKRTWCRQFLTL